MAGARKCGSQSVWREGLKPSLKLLPFMAIGTFAYQEPSRRAPCDNAAEAASLGPAMRSAPAQASE